MTDSIPPRLQDLADQLDRLMTQSSAKPTLVYLDVMGIGWPIHCLLRVAGVDYDFVRMSLLEWSARTPDGDFLLKPRVRNGHLPLFVDGDLRLNQSNVILAHLAEQHDLFGDAPEERLAAMEVMAHAYDALFHWNGMLTVNAKVNVPDDVVRDRLAAFLGDGAWGVSGNGYRNHLNGFLHYLQANPKDGGFMVGDRLSVADLHAFNVLANWYKAFDRSLFSNEFPDLDAYIERIATIPAVSDYIRNHQEPTTWIPFPAFGIALTSAEETLGLTSVR
ncbi:MAG: glutathione S-transferase [bacterium]|nr:glutathione S-transferase [bacterium]